MKIPRWLRWMIRKTAEDVVLELARRVDEVEISEASWRAFLESWATNIAAELNSTLPDGYCAEPNVRFGTEIDAESADPAAMTEGLNDVAEVRVFESENRPILAGVIELVSQAIKDRPGYRRAFAAKCAGILEQGAGLAVVDLETAGKTTQSDEVPIDADLYAIVYRPASQDGQPHPEIVQEPAIVRESIRLWLAGNRSVSVELAAAFQKACREQKIAVFVE